MTDEPWPNRPWLAVTPTAGALDLAAGGLALELPGQLADLRDGLRGNGLAETRQAARRVDRDPAADRRRTAAQQLLGLALGAQPQVLIPVEFQRGGQVVDLGHAHVLGSDAGLGVGGVQDLVLEHPIRRGHHRGGIRCDVRQFGQMLRIARRHGRHRPHRRHALEPSQGASRRTRRWPRSARPRHRTWRRCRTAATDRPPPDWPGHPQPRTPCGSGHTDSAGRGGSSSPSPAQNLPTSHR